MAGPHRLRDGMVTLIGAGAAVAILVGYRDRPLGAFCLAAVILASTWLSVIDFREHRLPNRIVGPLAAAVASGVIIAGVAEDDLSRSWRALGFGLAVAVILLVANIAGGLGMGDVKYGFPMAATVGWFGWDALSITILITTAAGALVAIAMLLAGRGRNQHLSYGPYMALGLAGGLLITAPW